MFAKSGRHPVYLARGENHHRDRWTVSYVDVLTILLVFFMAAAAQVAARGPEVVNPVKNASPVNHALEDALRKLQSHGIDAHLSPRGLVVTLPQAVLFRSGDDQISADAMPMIGNVVEVLNDVPNAIRLAGYADSVPIRGGRFRNNWELAAARGLSLLELLSREFGIDEARLSVESFGSQSPHDTNESEQGRALNRRVEILILN